MSFGALSKEAKIALSIGSKMSKTMICSGKGGIIHEEFENTYKYIFKYTSGRFEITDEILKQTRIKHAGDNNI